MNWLPSKKSSKVFVTTTSDQFKNFLGFLTGQRAQKSTPGKRLCYGKDCIQPLRPTPQVVFSLTCIIQFAFNTLHRSQQFSFIHQFFILHSLILGPTNSRHSLGDPRQPPSESTSAGSLLASSATRIFAGYNIARKSQSYHNQPTLHSNSILISAFRGKLCHARPRVNPCIAKTLESSFASIQCSCLAVLCHFADSLLHSHFR